MNPAKYRAVEALARQGAMAREDFSATYDFTVEAHAIKSVSNALHWARQVSRKVPRSRVPPRQQQKALTETTDELACAVRRALEQLESAADDLKRELTARRLVVFRADFRAERFAFACGACDLCDEAPVAPLKCCGKSLCRPCLEETAFYSSKYGTCLTAACPYCRAAFAVYE